MDNPEHEKNRWLTRRNLLKGVAVGVAAGLVSGDLIGSHRRDSSSADQPSTLEATPILSILKPEQLHAQTLRTYKKTGGIQTWDEVWSPGPGGSKLLVGYEVKHAPLTSVEDTSTAEMIEIQGSRALVLSIDPKTLLSAREIAYLEIVGILEGRSNLLVESLSIEDIIDLLNLENKGRATVDHRLTLYLTETGTPVFSGTSGEQLYANVLQVKDFPLDPNGKLSLGVNGRIPSGISFDEDKSLSGTYSYADKTTDTINIGFGD